MPVLLGNQYLIPAPLFTINKQINFHPDGRPLNHIYNISLDGTLLPTHGSPSSTGWNTDGFPAVQTSITSFDAKFSSLMTKQEYLREYLSTSGLKLTYLSETAAGVSLYPKLVSIDFTPGTWVIKSDYSIKLQSDNLSYIESGNDISDTKNIIYDTAYSGLNLVSLSDSYQIRERDDGLDILEITRNLSSTASFIASGEGPMPWQNARTAVGIRISEIPFESGIINILPTGSTLLTSGYLGNLVEEESIDQLGGTYSLSQRYLFSYTNYIETRTISKNIAQNLLGDGGPVVESITVNGSITGLDVDNISANKLTNASGYWNTLSGTIGDLVGANGDPVSYSVNINPNAGIIDYSYQFVNNSGIFYKHSYDVSTNYNNSEFPTVTINGNIEGYTPDSLYSGTGPNYTKFDNAVTGWLAVSGTLKTLAFAYPALTPSGGLFSNNPLSQTITFNKANGTINYNLVFAYTSGTNVNYQNNYTIDLSTENASHYNLAGLNCVASIQGTVVGLQTGGDPNSKIENARTGWNTIKSSLYTLVNNEYSLLGTGVPVLGSGFNRRSVGINSQAGTISYTAAFNNAPPTSNNLIAIEDISVEENNATDLFAVQNIPGLLSGPIIQNIQTVSERRRNININFTLYPKPTSPFYWSYNDKSTIDSIASGIVSGLVPSGTRTVNYWFGGDSISWNPKGGLYSRTVNIVY